jgi:hypothetical protein
MLDDAMVGKRVVAVEDAKALLRLSELAESTRRRAATKRALLVVCCAGSHLAELKKVAA